MADCKTCKERRSATEPIPYIAHESAMARMERTIKRLWVLLIVVVVLLVATNGAWLWYESQFEEVTTSTETYTADASDGGNAIANGSGEVVVNGNS